MLRLINAACEAGSFGTGFLIAPRLIATVEHVVDGADSLLIQRDGRTIATGTVVGEARIPDVALVATSAPIRGAPLDLASRTPAVGDAVLALGYPLGLPLTVTQGTVSGLNRTIPIEGISRSDLLQTDAPINPGNSGGPLLSLADGEVVGLVDAGTDQANGIGFAVAAHVAEPLLQNWESAPQPVPGVPCPGSPSSGSLPVSKSPVSTRRYDGKAFEIRYPADWSIGDAEKRESYGTDTTFLSPADPNTLIRVDVTTHGGPIDPAIAAGPVIDAVSKELGYELLVQRALSNL